MKDAQHHVDERRYTDTTPIDWRLIFSHGFASMRKRVTKRASVPCPFRSSDSAYEQTDWCANGAACCASDPNKKFMGSLDARRFERESFAGSSTAPCVQSLYRWVRLSDDIVILEQHLSVHKFERDEIVACTSNGHEQQRWPDLQWEHRLLVSSVFTQYYFGMYCRWHQYCCGFSGPL